LFSNKIVTYTKKEKQSSLSVGTDRSGGQFLPNEVSNKFIQKQLKYVKIWGIMPKGSVFTIVACEEERHPEDTFRRFKAKLENS
jgi:hypothetical protein